MSQFAWLPVQCVYTRAAHDRLPAMTTPGKNVFSACRLAALCTNSCQAKMRQMPDIKMTPEQEEHQRTLYVRPRSANECALCPHGHTLSFGRGCLRKRNVPASIHTPQLRVAAPIADVLVVTHSNCTRLRQLQSDVLVFTHTPLARDCANTVAVGARGETRDHERDGCDSSILAHR